MKDKKNIYKSILKRKNVRKVFKYYCIDKYLYIIVLLQNFKIKM